MRTPHSNYIQPIKKRLKVQPPLENSKNFFDITNGSRDIGNLMFEATTDAHPQSNFFQPIERSPKVEPPLENPKIFIRFSISLTIFEICAILRWGQPPQSTTPFRKPINFTRFSISLTVHEI